MGLSWSSGDLSLFLKFPALTVALFHALACPKLSRKTAEAKLAFMKREYVIESFPLRGNKERYSLTKSGARSLGQLRRYKPLGAQAIMRSLASASHAVKRRVHINSKEETHKFAEVFFGEKEWPRGIPSNLCYTDHSGDTAAFVCPIIDYGKHLRRLQKSVEKIFRSLEAYSVTRSLLQGDHYRIVILTGFETKAAQIRRLSFPYPVTVEVIPELGELLRGQ
jgi:hypothetical protein